MFPVLRSVNVLVFDWVPVDVVEVAIEIVVIFDHVFPESWLPDSAAAFVLFALRNSIFMAARFQPSFCKFFFDPANSF